jgi:hypothetical protein
MPPKVGADELTAAGMGQADLQRLEREPVSLTKAGPPEVVALGDELRFLWPALTVEAVLTHPRDHSDGIRAELAILVASVEVHWGQLNLASGPAREGVVKKLGAIDRGLPWREVLESTCRLGAQAFRAGEPVICLMPALRTEALRFLIPKLLVRGESNVLFADGGHGKSVLALTFALAASSGAALPGIAAAPEPVNTLYLDWESCVEEHEDRLAKLMAGAGLTEAPPILYRPMTRPLAEEAAAIRTEISRHSVGLVIVDSWAPACGAEPEGADATVRTMNAMRAFGHTTRLALAHVSKTSAEQRSGPTKPFGSVFVQNLARNVWELRGTQDEDSDELRMGLFHRKVNGSRLLGSIGLRFTFAPDRILLAPVDIAREPDLVAHASLPKRIAAALASGALTVEEIAEHVGAPEKSVAAKLRTLKGKGTVLRLDNDEQGRGRWGLPQ